MELHRENSDLELRKTDVGDLEPADRLRVMAKVLKIPGNAGPPPGDCGGKHQYHASVSSSICLTTLFQLKPPYSS